MAKKKGGGVSLVSAAGASDSDSDDDSKPSAFFTLEADHIEAEDVSFLKPNAKQPQIEEQPAVAGPSRPQFHEEAESYYPEADDVMANTAALERLAGKHALRNSQKIPEADDMIDVNMESLKGDPSDWITKAMADEDADKPGPKCTVKGLTKKKHQITYLAAMAKQDEHKLKGQWAVAAANKRMAGAKYGFF